MDRAPVIDQYEYLVPKIYVKSIGAEPTVTVERGLDPRAFAVFGYGGAGAVYAAFLARQVGSTVAYVPADSGVFSALGMLTTDFVFQEERSLLVRPPLGSEGLATVNDLLGAPRGGLPIASPPRVGTLSLPRPRLDVIADGAERGSVIGTREAWFADAGASRPQTSTPAIGSAPARPCPGRPSSSAWATPW